MNLRMSWLVVTLAVLSVACDNNANEVLIPGTPPPTTETKELTAREFYEQEVHPALDLTCTWCHAASEAGEDPPGEAPQWLSLDASTSYDNIVAYSNLIAHPENSLLLLQGEHMGPALQPKQEGLVREWLLMEVEERGLPVPSDIPDGPDAPPARSAEEALQQFADCMDRATWDQYEMYLLPHNQTTGWGVCRGCHNRGFAGAFLDDDQTLTYEQNKKLPYLLKFVTAQVEDGAFVDLVESDRMKLKGTEICSYEDPALCHPKYVLNPAISANISAWFTAMHQMWSSETCGTPPQGGGGGGGGGGGAP